MRHVTYQPKYDGLEKSGLLRHFGIDKDSVDDSAPDMRPVWQAGLLSDIEYLASELRRSACRDEDGYVLGAMALLFGCCGIETVAVPKRCAGEPVRLAIWFPGVDWTLRCEYVLDGEKMMLFGSEKMVGDRACDMKK